MATVTHFPIVFEPEASGAVSAYVVGLPVYAQAPTEKAVARDILATLDAYLAAHPNAASGASIKVARRERHGQRSLSLKSVAALVASRTSRRKAAAARANGRLGGRPRKSVR